MASSAKQPIRWLAVLVYLGMAGGITGWASELSLSISQPATDSSLMTVEASYPSSLIQSPWEIYSRADMSGDGTDGWTRIASAQVLTGGVFTSWTDLAGTNQFYALGRQIDSDGDGLSDAYEQLTSHTDPQKADTDGDGVTDGDETNQDFTDPRDAASHSTQTILRARGKLIVDASGKPVLLRGINMGGWLSSEQWMIQFQPTNFATDDYTVRNTLNSRFGVTGTVYLLDVFRDHYFTAADLDELKTAGFNFLRVPFPANLLENETNLYHYMDSGWARLDWVIAQCAARHMTCLLDLHGAQGSQNPWDHSGRENYNQLWFNTNYQKRAVALWSAIAQRYANNAAVAGYDILNEPYMPNTNQYRFFTNSIIPLYNRMYRAIRSNDAQHIVFVESTEQLSGSDTACWWMPNPATIGWSNVVYEFHHYDGIIGNWVPAFTYQKSVLDRLILRYADLSERYQVPVFLGEFNSIYPQNMDYFTRQCSANGILWTPWNYKHWGDWRSTQEPWSAWGLYYRADGSNAWLQPNLQTDTWADLVWKFSQYDNSQFRLNPHLLDVVQREAGHPDPAIRKTEFYVNTFSAHDQNNRASPNDAWPWLKLGMSGGDDNTYVMTNHRGRLVLKWGTNIQLRLLSRPEADARFQVNDSTGCWFSAELARMGTNSNIQLGAMRDALTNALWSGPTPGIIAQVQGRTNGQTRLRLYVKSPTQTNSFGTLMYTGGWTNRLTNRVLELYVNSTGAILRCDGSNYWSGAHSNNLGSWINGAAAVLEADNGSSVTPQTFVEMGAIKAWRPDAAWSGRFEDDFASHPNQLPLLAAPDHWSMQDFGRSNNCDAYYQDGAVVVTPAKADWATTWLNPRRDFGNDLRLPAGGESFSEFRATFSRHTNGCVKLCFMPEYMPRETYWLYDRPFVFAEIRDQPGNQMLFHIFRQQGVSNLVSCGSNFMPYAEGQSFSFQISSNQAAVYYGSSLVVSASHGITNFAQAYPYGLYPHLEFQNYGLITTALTRMSNVVIRTLPGFTAPE
jgi:endoglucanase